MSASPKRGSRRKPGVENMLGHAPPPLTANGLDMRDGHPAELEANEGSQARFSRLGALKRRGKKNRRQDQKRKGAAADGLGAVSTNETAQASVLGGMRPSQN